ncbi:serine hydrolase domain-containing protein [Actinophytocola sp.]|uniref:serine hydrolase domain-containing protein n=1 Tax=Actinophytocola sp. TaxID=1872138 RepID=UPI002D29985E|nr:serine hydrolase domain-containing protein [Actinophytocola sp.]HYQ63050.1 serine hydrolase domain-containing protein [Actinophytocola sp.]
MGVRERRLGGVVLAAVLAVGVAQGPASATTRGRPELRQAMVAAAQAGLAGVQLRIHDDQGDWTGSAGVRELSGGRVPTDGRFRVGSITKTFVSTVMLQLVNEGRVVLDDPVAKYLPEYGFDPRITVRMILAHTTGLFNYTGEPRPDGTVEPGIPLFGNDFAENRFRTYTPRELIEVALAKPARFAPGTSWSYSNTNFVVAGQLIERVTRTPWAVQVYKRVIGPLGLRDTVVPGTRAAVPGPHAHGYYAYHDAGEFRVLDVTRLNPSWASSAGEIISTTRDLDRFISALLGGRLLPANLLAEMKTPSPFAPYGIGLMVLEAGPDCGGTYYGHTGSIHGYQSYLFSSPDRATRVEVSVTMGGADVDDPAVAQRISTAINDLLVAALCDGPPASPMLAEAAA